MMKMLSFTVSAIALTLSAGEALASDLPSRRAPPPPPYFEPAPVATWTGFYAGVNAGGTWAQSNSVNVWSAPILTGDPTVNMFPVPTAGAAALAASGTLPSSSSGFIGGGQIGYNSQISSNFVAGIEADIQGIGGGGGSSGQSNVVTAPISVVGVPAPNNFVGTTISAAKSLDYIGTVRGRIGYLFTPTLLAYATGGLAYGGVSSSTSVAGTTMGYNLGLAAGNAAYFSNGGFSDTRVGWTAGGGLEWMFLSNWSAKFEYLYYNLGSVSYSAGIPASIVQSGTTGGLPVGSAFYALASQSSASFNGHIVRAGLNYHFNWAAPAPLVAKY
jgi:outer membrane immunogenic protein